MIRYVIAFLAVSVPTIPALAQPVNLTEKTTLGERGTFAIDLDLKGNLIVAINNGKQSIPLEAKAKHRFTERTLAMSDGLPSTTARFYTEATASATLENDKSTRSLPADRKLIVAKRYPDGLVCFAPNGPLNRDELDLVSDHFNPQCLSGLLPGKVVNIGDTWSLTDIATQVACLFNATIKTTLSGKLTAVKDGVAMFTINGEAEGIENGAKVSLTVTATGTFDVTSGHIIGLTWKQKDDREQGAVNPASQVEATVTLKRETPAAEPKELSEESLSNIPIGNLSTRYTDIRYIDPKGRYQIVHPREWHITGQTDSHLVMRLLDRGEFIAQATVSVWSKMEPGKHFSADEFKKAVATAPGWTPVKTLMERELVAPVGRWHYQVMMEGKMEAVPVIQTFYLLAGPQGDQIAVTVAAKTDKAKAIGNRDLNLINAIEFGKK